MLGGYRPTRPNLRGPICITRRPLRRELNDLRQFKSDRHAPRHQGYVEKALVASHGRGRRPDNSGGPCDLVPVGGHDCGRPLSRLAVPDRRRRRADRAVRGRRHRRFSMDHRHGGAGDRAWRTADLEAGHGCNVADFRSVGVFLRRGAVSGHHVDRLSQGDAERVGLDAGERSMVAIIVAAWPLSAAWTLGLLVGVNLLTSGVAIVMMAMAARGVVETVKDSIATARR